MKTPFSLPALLAVALVLSGCAKNEPAPLAVPPTVVQIAPVVYSDVAVPVRATGLLSRKAEAELSFKIGGVIDALSVRAGDKVAAGQELARLRLDEIDAQVAQARSAVEKGQRDLARIEKLETNHVATLENLQDARTAVDVAKAQLQIAEFNQHYAVITAPAAGRILRRLAEPGELVAPGKPIVDFAADGEGWLVRAGLADREIARLRVGDPAKITFDDGAARPLAGRITQISEAADPATRTTPIEITLDTAPDAVRSGSVVVVTLQPGPVPARPVVPAAVLIEGTGRQASLFVVDEGASTARRVPVEIESLVGADVYLRTLLPRTTRLVVAGGEYLHDGAAVEFKR